MSEEHQEIRRVRLLEGEEVWLALHAQHGLLEEVPPEDDCMLLTNQRLIGFSLEESQRRLVLLPHQSVDAVEITDLARSLRPLVTGGLLVLGAVAAVWLATAFSVGGILPWLIGGILVLLGAITASTYFVAEDTAMITFRARASEAALPLRTPQALRDAYLVANGFFQARAGQRRPPEIPTVEVSPPWQGTVEPSDGVDAPTPGTPSYPQEPAQMEAPEQPADDPVPGMTPHHQESTQAEGRNDV